VEELRRVLRPAVAEDFASSIADLLIGAEALEQPGHRQRREGRPLVREQRCGASVAEGIRWLRLRARTVGPGELKGRLWRLRRSA
jgi:hypothetical protein